MTLSAIILRLEGVFALTGDVYHEAMNEAFSEAGFAHRISREAFAETFGHDVGREVFLAYASRHLYPRKQTSDLRTLFEVTFKRLRQIAQERMAQAHTPAAEGAVDLLRAAQERGIQTILVTALPPAVCERLIANAGGQDAKSLFSRIIHQDLRAPAEAFQHAKAVVSGPVIVLESSTPGLAAAETAGLASVGVVGECVLANGIHGARAVVEKLPDLIDYAAGAQARVNGRDLLQALDAIVKTDIVIGSKMKIIDLQVRDVLRDKGDAVKSVNPTDTVQFLAQRLLSEKVGAMVVIADTGALEGIVSERDIARGVAAHGAGVLEMPVAAIMTPAVITCALSDSIYNVAKVMTARRIRHLPVAQGDDLVGLVSIGDVLNRRLEEVRYEASVLRHGGGPDLADRPPAGRG